MMLVDGVEIYMAEIDRSVHCSRREAERAAVESLIVTVFGSDATLEHYADGAPFVPGFQGEVSVSHSRNKAVLAVDRLGRKIGVDIEQWRDALRDVASRLLSDDERLWADSERHLLMAWTVKEAVYKALRPAGCSMLQLRLPDCPAATGRVGDVCFTSVAMTDDVMLTVAVEK